MGGATSRFFRNIGLEFIFFSIGKRLGDGSRSDLLKSVEISDRACDPEQSGIATCGQLIPLNSEREDVSGIGAEMGRCFKLGKRKTAREALSIG